MEVLTLHFGQKLGTRKIAKRLGINRKAVIRIIRSRKVKSERSSGNRKSLLDPYKERIRELLEKEPSITGMAILQDIRSKGYPGGKSILNDYISKTRIKPVPREAFLTLSFSPGECAQVDWGEFGDVFGNGVKIHCFAMVLAFSRKMYIEFTRSEKFEDFIRCHENAFK